MDDAELERIAAELQRPQSLSGAHALWNPVAALLEPILREMRDWGDRYKRRLVELRPGGSRSVPQRFPPR